MKTGETEFSETFGDKWQGGPLDIPSITWFSTPTISEVSKDKFSVLGREIHMSQVHRLMKDATKGSVLQGLLAILMNTGHR